MVNFSRPLIYSTGATPSHLQGVLASLIYFENDLESKQMLQQVIQYFRHQIKKMGLEPNFLESKTAIQSFMVSGNTKAKALAKHLNDLDFGIKAILNPTVPKGLERLRICLHCYNTKREINLLLYSFKEKL